MSIVVELMICELELVETDNLFHPLGTPRRRIWMNVNPKQKYTKLGSTFNLIYDFKQLLCNNNIIRSADRIITSFMKTQKKSKVDTEKYVFKNSIESKNESENRVNWIKNIT